MIFLFLSNPGRLSLIISANKDILIIVRIFLLEQAFSLAAGVILASRSRRPKSMSRAPRYNQRTRWETIGCAKST
jgi:hypothetical protein